MFNISGALVFIWFVPVIVQFVQFLTPGPELDVIARQIANAHTTFNVVCTLLWLPFIGVMVKIVTFLVPGKAGAHDQGALVNLDEQDRRSAGVRHQDVRRRAAEVLRESARHADGVARSHREQGCCRAQGAQGRLRNGGGLRETELANYAVELLSAGATSEKQAAEISDLMFIVDAVGRIGARCGEVSALYSERLSSKKQFSDEARQELGESAAMVAEMYGAVLQFLSDQDVASERVLDERRRQIIKRQSKARKDHFRRVSSQQCAPENKAVYNQLLLCLERAGNECSNLVEHGAELSMWGDSLGADRTDSRGGGSDELVEALA